MSNNWISTGVKRSERIFTDAESILHFVRKRGRLAFDEAHGRVCSYLPAKYKQTWGCQALLNEENPVLILGPFDIPPGQLRAEWIQEFQKLYQRGQLQELRYVVYRYESKLKNECPRYSLESSAAVTKVDQNIADGAVAQPQTLTSSHKNYGVEWVEDGKISCENRRRKHACSFVEVCDSLTLKPPPPVPPLARQLHERVTLEKDQPKHSERSLPEIGARISVLWPDDGEYFPATVQEIRGDFFLLHYDDDDEEWLPLAETCFKNQNMETTANSDRNGDKKTAGKEKQISRNGVGTSSSNVSQLPAAGERLHNAHKKELKASPGIRRSRKLGSAEKLSLNENGENDRNSASKGEMAGDVREAKRQKLPKGERKKSSSSTTATKARRNSTEGKSNGVRRSSHCSSSSLPRQKKPNPPEPSNSVASGKNIKIENPSPAAVADHEEQHYKDSDLAEIIKHPEKDAILRQLPHVQKLVGHVGFTEYEDMGFFPVLIVPPSVVPEGSALQQWRVKFKKAQAKNKLDKMHLLVYWYGSSITEKSDGEFGLIRKGNFLSFKNGVAAGYNKVPVELQKKLKAKKRLTSYEMERVHAIQELKRSVKMSPQERLLDMPWLPSDTEETGSDDSSGESVVEENRKKKGGLPSKRRGKKSCTVAGEGRHYGGEGTTKEDREQGGEDTDDTENGKAEEDEDEAEQHDSDSQTGSPRRVSYQARELKHARR